MDNVLNKNNGKAFSGEELICLLAAEGTAVYYYGPRALVLAALCVTVCLISAFAAAHLRRLPFGDEAAPAVITGLTLSLMMPASVPYYITVICGIFAEGIVIQSFGGHGYEIFSAPAAGYLLGEICFPQNVLRYPKIFDSLDMSSSVSNDLFRSFSASMLSADIPTVTDYELILGRCISPMGTGVLVLIAVEGIFLMVRKKVSPAAFIAQTVIYGGLSFLFKAGLPDLKYNLMSGMYLFVSVFITCRRSPKNITGSIAYGALTGLLTFAFRYYAFAENPIVYASIISAPFIGILSKTKAAAESESEVSSDDSKVG